MIAIDSNYLMELARAKSHEHRNVLAQTVSDLFTDGGTTLSDRERALMFDILHRVVRDAEFSVRRGISRKLAAQPDAPRDLMRDLANDEIEVAYPILVRCKVLQDIDLIEVVRNRTLEHQLAVAVRSDLSSRVSEALVETGDQRVIRELLKNQDACLSRATLAYLVEESKRMDSFQEPILHRRDLEPDLAKRMFLWVSAALRQHILTHFELDPETIDDLLEEAAQLDLATPGEPQVAADSCADLATTLVESGMATPEFLLQTLRDGEVPLFRALFGRLTQLRPRLVSRILFDPGGEGLAIACKFIGLDKPSFASLFTISRNARAKQAAAKKQDLRKVLNFYDRTTESAAAKVVRHWRRDENYLSAIADIELSP